MIFCDLQLGKDEKQTICFLFIPIHADLVYTNGHVVHVVSCVSIDMISRYKAWKINIISDLKKKKCINVDLNDLDVILDEDLRPGLIYTSDVSSEIYFIGSDTSMSQ